MAKCSASSTFITSSAARIFSLWLCLSAPALKADDDYQKRKMELLLKPVFSADQEKLTGKPKVKSVKETARPANPDNKPLPMPAAGSAPAVTQARPTSNGAPASAPSTGQAAQRLFPPTDAPSEKGKAPPKGTCGHNDYLGSFCFHRQGPNEWLLCTTKWGECTKRTDSGCLAADTLVRMADGSLRRAASLRVRDQLWDVARRQPLTIQRLVIGEERLPLINLNVNGTVLKITTTHPVLTQRGWITAKNLLAWDQLILESGQRVSAGDITETPAPNESVINFIFEEEARGAGFSPQLSTEGIVTGAYLLQKRLEKAVVR